MIQQIEKKHLLVREQNPDIDIRFLFVNANNKLNKSSKTTYGAWCDKNKILWAEKKDTSRMVIDNIELETEKMSLLPNKFYLIMTPSADGQAFDVTAYDTTDPKKPIPSAFFCFKRSYGYY